MQKTLQAVALNMSYHTVENDEGAPYQNANITKQTLRGLVENATDLVLEVLSSDCGKISI